MNWYVVYVFDDHVQELLTFFNRQDGMYAFLPKIEKFKSKQGVKFYEPAIMFPDYIFIKTNLSKKEVEEKMKIWKSHISSIVRHLSIDDEVTMALQDQEQEYLESVLNEEYVMTHSIGIIKDSQLIIQSGPLVGKEHLVKKIDRHRRVAFLDLNIFGTTLRVPLEITHKS